MGIALVGVALFVSGCATKSDIRDLQDVVAESSRNQEDMLLRLERAFAVTADSLQRSQSDGRVELQGSVLNRLNSISDRLDRLEALSQYIGDEVANMRDDLRDADVRQQASTRPLDLTNTTPSVFSGGQTASELLQQARDDHTSGSLAAAKMGYEAFIEDYPDDSRVALARYRRALILRESGDADVALTAFQEIQQLYPDDANVPATLYHIAELYIELGEPGEARNVLRRLINTYPNHLMEGFASTLLREIGGGIPATSLDESAGV